MTLKIYCSSGFKNMKTLEKLIDELVKEPIIQENYSFIIPRLLTDCKYHEYVFSDLKSLHEADIMIIHMPEPSIGAAAELGYFKAIKPYAPIISYKSINHGWIERLCLLTNTKEEVLDVLTNIILAKSYIS